MKNNIVRILCALAVTLGVPAQSFAQKSTIRAVGVSAELQEISPFTVEVTRALETRVYAVPTSITFQENSTTLPSSLSQLKSEYVSNFTFDRFFGMTHLSNEVLNIIGKRMATMPAETLTLSENDPALKRAAAISEYLRTVWGIAPGRITTLVKKQTLKNCVELVSIPLLKPLAVTDTLATATPPIIRFYSTMEQVEENPAQWSIDIRQNGKSLRSPISAAGKIRPAVDWKINKEKNTIPLASAPLKYTLEIRYPTIANWRTAPAEIPVRIITEVKSYSYEAVLPFIADESTLNAAQNSVLGLIREKKWLQATSKVTIQSFGTAPLQGTPTKEFEEKQRLMTAQRLKTIEKSLGNDLPRSAYKGELVPNIYGIISEVPNCIVIRIENPIP